LILSAQKIFAAAEGDRKKKTEFRTQKKNLEDSKHKSQNHKLLLKKSPEEENPPQPEAEIVRLYNWGDLRV
jgi:hypothetical protein